MATQFLWYPGTSSNNGQTIATSLSLMTTELNALANGYTAKSSVGGSSGFFNNSNTAQALFGDIFLTLGAVGSALVTGAACSGWFLTAFDDTNTNIEHVTTGAAGIIPPRAPDFIIPLPATTITAGWIFKSAQYVPLPALPFFVFVANNTGQTWAATTNVLRVAPYTPQY